MSECIAVPILYVIRQDVSPHPVGKMPVMKISRLVKDAIHIL